MKNIANSKFETYLLLIAHGDLNENHREVTILGGFKIERTAFGNGFDLLEPDPETTQTQK